MSEQPKKPPQHPERAANKPARKSLAQRMGQVHIPDPDQLRDAIAQGENLAAPPQYWAYLFALELAENNGWDYATQAAAEAQIMGAFEARAESLPLLQYPSFFPLPNGRPLPPKWFSGCFMLKAELRDWAREHVPDLLGSALLAEATPESAPAGEAATIAGPHTDKAAPDWKAEARSIATEIHARHLGLCIEGTLKNYAEETAAELRKRGIGGPNGWLSAGTVLRDALQAAQWWQIRPRSLPSEDKGSVGTVGNVGSLDAG